jgi:hypothetical protein
VHHEVHPVSAHVEEWRGEQEQKCEAESHVRSYARGGEGVSLYWETVSATREALERAVQFLASL